MRSGVPSKSGRWANCGPDGATRALRSTGVQVTAVRAVNTAAMRVTRIGELLGVGRSSQPERLGSGRQARILNHAPARKFGRSGQRLMQAPTRKLLHHLP